MNTNMLELNQVYIAEDYFTKQTNNTSMPMNCEQNFLHKQLIIYIQTTCIIILASNPTFHIKNMILSELHKFDLKLFCKQYYKIYLLHQIVAPQLCGGGRHNYSTKTR